MIESSKALDNLLFKYTHLPVGGKEVVCPYWMNNLEKGIYGPIGGKGTPVEIVSTTNEHAISEKVDLNKMDVEAIDLFMRACRIGVDCSGFVFWMLNELDLEKGGNGIADNIPGSTGKVIKARASVAMLCSDNVSRVVEKINEVKIGDMIRLRRGKHIAIITKIKKDSEGVIEIEYSHSSDITRVKGVHAGKIKIINEFSGLGDQEWEETIEEGVSYGTEFCSGVGDSIRRLNIWK